MNHTETLEIASGIRALTDAELAMVGGGNALVDAIKTAAAAVGSAIGYLAAGPGGAAAGSIAASATVDAIVDSNQYGGMTANYF